MSAQSQEQTKSDNRLAELLDSTLSPSSTASKESNTSNKTTFIGTINATDISNVESPSQSNGSSFLAALDSTTLSPTSADTNVSNTSNETTFIGTIGIETDTSNVGSPMTIESNNFSFSTVDEGQPQDITSKDVNQMVGEENINVNTNTVVRSSYKKADGDTVPLGDNGEKVSKEDDERKTGSLQLLATPAVESKFNRKKDDASADPLNQLCSNQGGDVGVGVDSASSLPSADETVPFNNKVLKSHLSPNGSSSTQNSDDKGDDGQEDNEEEIAQEDSANEGDREGIIANVASLAPTMIPRSECNSEESLETKTDKPKTPNQEIMGLLHRKLPPAKPRFTFLNLAVIVMIASILAVIAIEVSATQCSVFASSFSCVPSFMQSFLILLVWDIIWDNTGRKSGNRVWVWGTFNTLLALFAVTDEINTTMKLPITLFGKCLCYVLEGSMYISYLVAYLISCSDYCCHIRTSILNSPN